ncbi:MAG: cupin domain-containing protein [Candidatus Moranbacteria bacterium]|nr:cupin domain-containing protein [Candidatus Moranbacteria bacterium]
MSHYFGNVRAKSVGNRNFKETVHIGQKMELSVMSLEPDEETGEEIRADHDRYIRVEEGQAKLILDGSVLDLVADEAVVVPAGSRHEIVNASSEVPLKLSVVSAPPEHRVGAVYPRKRDA